MRKPLASILALFLAFGLARAAESNETKDVKAIVDKAVKALGGADKVAAFKGATWKGKGKYSGLGEAISFTGEWATQPPEQTRVAIKGEFGGVEFQRILVVNGDKGWIKLNDNMDEMDKETLTEEKERIVGNWVASLAPLLSTAADLKALGEQKINDKPAIGLWDPLESTCRHASLSIL